MDQSMIQSQSKRVLIISYYWPPSGGSGVQRWVKFAKYLKLFGWTPVIITVDPKKASYFQLDHSQIEEVTGIETYYTNSIEPLKWLSKIIGKKNVPHSGFSNVKKSTFKQKVLRFMRGNLYTIDPRIGWNKFAFKKAKELIHSQDIRFVITTSPPHSTQLIGQKLKNKLDICWIADLRDPWTDIFYYKNLYKSSILVEIEKRKEIQVLKEADLILTVGHGLKNLFAKKIIDDTKIEVIPNGYDLDIKQKTICSKGSIPDTLEGNFKLVYIGIISDAYNIDALFGVIESIKSSGNWLHLTFIGHQANAIKEKVIDLKLENEVTFIPYIDKSELDKYYLTADCALLVIPSTPDNELIVTGKIFEYLARHLPVLGIGPVSGDAASILRETDSGEMFNYEDINGIMNFLIEIQQNRKEYKFEGIEKYSRKETTRELAGILNDLYSKEIIA